MDLRNIAKQYVSFLPYSERNVIYLITIFLRVLWVQEVNKEK